MIRVVADGAAAHLAIPTHKVIQKGLEVPICAVWTHNVVLVLPVVHDSLLGKLRGISKQVQSVK